MPLSFDEKFHSFLIFLLGFSITKHMETPKEVKLFEPNPQNHNQNQPTKKLKFIDFNWRKKKEFIKTNKKIRNHRTRRFISHPRNPTRVNTRPLSRYWENGAEKGRTAKIWIKNHKKDANGSTQIDQRRERVITKTKKIKIPSFSHPFSQEANKARWSKIAGRRNQYKKKEKEKERDVP